ncbi:MAG: preprotein translocase subunit YajC [Candidatus Kapabacteria bacterium]|nr:preprotein translocase subunit YajC [Candidatus Kapabacteria bacterium]
MALLLFMAPAPQGGGDATGQLIQTFVMFGAIILIFYFMMIRPQQKRAKEHKAMLDSIKKGDKVILTSGMHGSIYEINETTAIVTVAANTQITFDRAAIASKKSE